MIRPRDSAPRHKTTAHIRPHNGVPTLFINGKPDPALAYMTYVMDPKCLRDFAKAGVRTYSFSVSSDYDYYKFSADGWPEPDKYVYDDFDARMRMVLEACPEAMVFPRVYLCSPAWWDRKHPDQLMAGKDGAPYNPKPDWGWLPESLSENTSNLAKLTVPSFSSQQWLKDSGQALQRFLRYAEDRYGEHIIGYHVCSGGTQEWYYWGAFEDTFADYSRPQQEAFAKWLTDRGWGNVGERPVPSYEDRMAAEVGLFRDPTQQDAARVVEYWQFHAHALVAAMKHFCGLTRTVIGPDKLIGVFFGYFMDLQRMATCWHNSGHLAFAELQDDPNINFLTSPTSYKDRRMGTGYSVFNGLVESLAAHNKLWMNENDIQTPLAPPSKGSLYYMPKTMLESNHLQKREFANVLCHGSGGWWFDMWSKWFADKKTMGDIARMVQVAGKSVHADRTPTAEIALVVDDRSVCFTQCTNTLTVPAITDQVMQMGHVGAPFSMVHVDDIERVRPHKMYLFLNVFHVDTDRLERIHRAVRRKGVTSVFVFAPGIIDELGVSPSAMRKLTGMDLHMETAVYPLQVQLASALGLAVESYGPAEPLSPVVYCTDGQAEVLGKLIGWERAGLASKTMGDGWVSVFSSAPCLPTELVQLLARRAGVHLFARDGEVVYANRSFLGVFSKPKTAITLHTGDDAALYELFTDKEYLPKGGIVKLPQTIDGAWMFYRGSKANWQELGDRNG